MRYPIAITIGIVGLLVWTLPAERSLATTATMSASPTLSVYERYKLAAEKEHLVVVEPAIAKFVIAVVKDKYSLTFNEEDIGNAVSRYEVFLNTCGGFGKNSTTCATLAEELQTIVERERRVRKLGRDLFMAAGDYELAISEHLGKVAALPPIFGSIVNIWQSGSDDATTSNGLIRMSAELIPEPKSDATTKYDELKASLQDLVEGEGKKETLDRLASAVTRYRYGYRSVQAAEGGCPSGITGTGGELGQLSERHCTVEEKLNAVWNFVKMAAARRDPPPGNGEIILFPTRIFRNLNIIVWASNHDAGLDWEIPMEPVLPRLMDDREYQECMKNNNNDEAYCTSLSPKKILRGGKYLRSPETPLAGVGICNMPVGSTGFLCRPLIQDTCAIPSPSSSSSLAGVYLGECKQPLLKGPSRLTANGPDICGIGGWKKKTEIPKCSGNPPICKDTPNRDPLIIPGKCSNCAVDFYCAASCIGGGAFTEPKQANGVIPICIPTSFNGNTAVLSSFILHELVHAQQSCSNPRDIFSGDACCSAEYQAYLAQCRMLEQDGILKDADVRHQGRPVEVSATLCAAVFSSLSCNTSCSDSPVSPAHMKTEIFASIERNKERLKLPSSCAEAIENIDPRAEAILGSLPSPCNQECRSEYHNSIGNNLCFIGQCIEQSWEQERIVPGRMTQNVGDEAFPWDSCLGTDPLAYTAAPSASQVVLPTMAFPAFPDYRPWDIAHITERALCQILGLPMHPLPTLCTSEIARQLGRSMSDPLDILIALTRAVDEQLSPAEDLERMAPSIGTRVATTLYRNQVPPMRQALSDILHAAATLLEEISNTRFPARMCSRVDRACPYTPPR